MSHAAAVRNKIFTSMISKRHWTHLSDDTIRRSLLAVRDDDLKPLETIVREGGIDPAIAAHLITSLTPEQFSRCLPDLPWLIETTTYAEGEDLRSRPTIADCIGDIARIIQRVCVVIPYDTLASIDRLKLKALIRTVYNQPRIDAYGNRPDPTYWWGKKRIDATIQEVMKHLTIVTESDAEKTRNSETGMMFRRMYVHSLIELFRIHHRQQNQNQNVYTYPDELIHQLYTLQSSNPEDYKKVTALFNRERSVGYANSALHFVPLVPDMDANWTGMILAAMHYCFDAPESTDYSKEPKDVQAICVALLTVLTAAIQDTNATIAGMHIINNTDEDEPVMAINDPRVITLIKENPDRASNIATYARERSNLDYDAIVEVLKQQPVLSQGTL